MTTKRWDFRDEDLHRYTVEIEHGFWSGKRVITVNGREVVRERKLFSFDPGSQHGFDVDGHAALLRIRTSGMIYAFDLYVDGIAISPQGTRIPRPGPGMASTRSSVATTTATTVTAPASPRAALERRVRR